MDLAGTAERIASEAIPISKDTTLGRIASAYRPAEDHSGFRLMPLGTYSLDTRSRTTASSLR